MLLRRYFEDENLQLKALSAVSNDWFNARELDLYEASLVAFDPGSTRDAALRSFTLIYDELASSRWNAFRPFGRARCWPGDQIFDTIRRAFSDYPWRGPVNLTNLHNAPFPIESCLMAMRGIKPNQGFPHMTVSKFLHFYNPALFPIYDTEVIWNKVFRRFDSDFRSFCWDARVPYEIAIKDDTAAFLPYYILWANSLMSIAHSSFMQTFRHWLVTKPETALSIRKFDVTTLYARAFEYTATGAATLDASALVV